MRQLLFLLAFVAIAAVVVAAVVIRAWLVTGPAPDPAPVETAVAADPVARGEYLVTILGCDDCHTPKVVGPDGPVPDMSRRMIGHPADAELSPPPELSGGWLAASSADLTAWYGPWGISYAANLTPDEITGIDIWTEQMFLDAIRTGRHMGTSRPIMPPMPWPAYANLPDADLNAILAFLKSLPAISNQVPEYEPPAQ